MCVSIGSIVVRRDLLDNANSNLVTTEARVFSESCQGMVCRP